MKKTDLQDMKQIDEIKMVWKCEHCDKTNKIDLDDEQSAYCKTLNCAKVCFNVRDFIKANRKIHVKGSEKVRCQSCQAFLSEDAE